MKNWFIWGIIVLFFFIIISCEDEPCDTTIESLVGIEFFIPNQQGEIPDTVQLSIYNEEIADTLLERSLNGGGTVFLPLAPQKDQSQFIFSLDSLKDTLTFEYQRDYKLVSQDCGFRTIFMIDTVIHTRNRIDSISVLRTTVNSANAKHIEVYLF